MSKITKAELEAQNEVLKHALTTVRDAILAEGPEHDLCESGLQEFIERNFPREYQVEAGTCVILFLDDRHRDQGSCTDPIDSLLYEGISHFDWSGISKKMTQEEYDNMIERGQFDDWTTERLA